MTDEKETFLVAAKGFSANGVTIEEGEYVIDQFDAQTIVVLQRMGRLVETDAAPGETDAPDETDAAPDETDAAPGETTRGRGKRTEPAAPVAPVDAGTGLPGLPGTEG